MIYTLIALVLIPTLVPVAMLALRLSKRHRNLAYMAAAFLLMFGMNVKVDPPPPPHIEAVEHDEDAEDDGLPATGSEAAT